MNPEKTVTNEQDVALLIGASWYPEMWPEAEWPKDVERMQELGFNVVRLFEFAWHRFEPKEGQYDFDWAVKVMDLCARSGIAVMVGTPTAAPPAWLTAAYPEVLKTKADGSVYRHGQRKHFNQHSRKYRELARKIVSKMVEIFKDHPALHSWQIDNELSGTDYGSETHGAFHAWLEKKYGSVEKLNATWGLEFWSQAYSEFRQIPLVTASVGSIEVPERNHPSLIMAFARFTNEGWSNFISEQCEVIRAGSDKPITTNMTAGLGMHWFEHNRAMDRVGHSLYRDVLHYDRNVQIFDRMRAEKRNADGAYRPYWLLETAPSWSAGGRTWNIHHDERGVKAMNWMSAFLGGSMTLFWQWREHWAGQEMLHGTLVTATGKWRPNKEAMQELSGRMKAYGSWLLDNPPLPAKVALLQSNVAAWGLSIDPTDDNMKYEDRWREDYLLPLFRQHIWRDVIWEHADFSPYKVILMPLMPIVPEETRQRLREWVEKGGCLLLGPLTGYRSEEFTAFTDHEFGGLEELMGAVSGLRFTVQWVEDKVKVVFPDGGATSTRTWCEGFRPTTATVLAKYQGGYGDGLPAVLRNSFGKGVVITLGCMVDEPTYISLVRDLLAQHSLGPIAQGDSNVVVAPRSSDGVNIAGYGVVNISLERKRVVLPHKGKDLFTGNVIGREVTLEPLQAMLIETLR